MNLRGRPHWEWGLPWDPRRIAMGRKAHLPTKYICESSETCIILEGPEASLSGLLVGFFVASLQKWPSSLCLGSPESETLFQCLCEGLPPISPMSGPFHFGEQSQPSPWAGSGPHPCQHGPGPLIQASSNSECPSRQVNTGWPWTRAWDPIVGAPFLQNQSTFTYSCRSSESGFSHIWKRPAWSTQGPKKFLIRKPEASASDRNIPLFRAPIHS